MSMLRLTNFLNTFSTSFTFLSLSSAWFTSCRIFPIDLISKMDSKLGLVLIFFNCSILIALGINQDTKYSDQEKDALEKFHKAVEDLVSSDYQKLDSYAIHILRETNLDVNKGKEKFKKIIDWREANSIEGILNDTQVVNLEKTFPFWDHVMDLDGRPVVISPVGKHDVRRFILQGHRELYKRYNYYATEKIAQKIYRLDSQGKDVSQFISVSDLAGVNPKQLACLPCFQVLTEMTKEILDHYPNILYQTILINAPRSFASIYKLFEPVLPEKEQQKIHIFGFDKKEWIQYLASLIGEKHMDQLPKNYRSKL